MAKLNTFVTFSSRSTRATSRPRPRRRTARRKPAMSMRLTFGSRPAQKERRSSALMITVRLLFWRERIRVESLKTMAIPSSANWMD